MEDVKLLSLLQISDSGFPTGGFSHSGGLEPAIRIHNVTDSESLQTFLRCSLENSGSFLLPFVCEAHQGDTETGTLELLDELCEASTPNHVANRASTRQGRSLLDTSQRVFKLAALDTLGQCLPYKHYPVVYGVVCASLGISLQATCIAFLFTTLKTILASAVRLDQIGPIQAQTIQMELQLEIPAVFERHKQRKSGDACMMYPHVDIIQNTHDALFSKLFYS